MKIKKNTILLTVITVLFSLTGALSIYAEDNTIPPGLRDKQKDLGKRPYGWDQGKKKGWNKQKDKGKLKHESDRLFFQNRTPYAVTVFVSTKKGNQTPTELGKILARGAATMDIKDGLIGHNGTRYAIELEDKEGTFDSASLKKELKFKWKGGDSYTEDLTFEMAGKDKPKNATKMVLEINFNKDTGIGMILKPADNK